MSRLCMCKRNRADRRFDRGFTLLEVIIALAILGIGLTVIMELFSGGLRLGRVSEEYTKAMNYACLKMEEIAIQNTVTEGEDEGEFDEGQLNGTYRWKVTVEKVDILPGDKGTEFKPPVEFYHVRVNITWMAGSKEKSASLESYKTVKPGTDEKKT